MTLVSTLCNPVPASAVSGIIETSDGVRLRFARWDSLEPDLKKGTVCVFHGRGEFIEKYFETVNELRARGFAIATMDWRGQGHSSRKLPDRKKGYVKSFSEFETDVEAFMQQVVLPNCPEPYYVLAHSMGGAALLRVLHSGKHSFKRIVLSAPMIDLPGVKGSWVARVIARSQRLMGFDEQYAPGGGPDQAETFDKNTVTSDSDRFYRNAAIVERDATLAIGSSTVAWANAAFDTIDAFRTANYPLGMTQPTLIFAAGRDTIVSVDAIKQFAARLPNASHCLIADAKHEILQERDGVRAQFWAEFNAFIP